MTISNETKEKEIFRLPVL